MMTETEKGAFWRFKLKPLALMIHVFIARGDYAQPMQPLKPGELVFDESTKLATP
jgi:hypothetical protein